MKKLVGRNINSGYKKKNNTNYDWNTKIAQYALKKYT